MKMYTEDARLGLDHCSCPLMNRPTWCQNMLSAFFSPGLSHISVVDHVQADNKIAGVSRSNRHPSNAAAQSGVRSLCHVRTSGRGLAICSYHRNCPPSFNTDFDNADAVASGSGTVHRVRIETIVSTRCGPPNVVEMAFASSAPHASTTTSSTLYPCFCAMSRISLCIRTFGSTATYLVTRARSRYGIVCPWPAPMSNTTPYAYGRMSDSLTPRAPSSTKGANFSQTNEKNRRESAEGWRSSLGWDTMARNVRGRPCFTASHKSGKRPYNVDRRSISV